jgi:O-methyltransferase
MVAMLDEDVTTTGRELYLDLLQKILVNEIYQDPPLRNRRSVRRAKRKQKTALEFELSERDRGLDWPTVAHTMIGRQRLGNLRACVEQVLKDTVPGDLIETGVWRGGACILMRGILKAYGETERKVWVADSFEGLPPPNPELYDADSGDRHHTITALAVSLEQVKANFSVYGLLDTQVEFLKGWFRDTLPRAPIRELAVIRLDGDMYESTMDGLVNLYPRLSPGGFLIVDDYNAVRGCKAAVHDYLATLDKTEQPAILDIDGTAVYWQRPGGPRTS